MGTIWDKRKAVERMQMYIESNLEQPITLHALSRAGAYSMYHAARVFKEITGLSPFEYIRRRRLSLAAKRLTEKRERVIDVAFDFVFDSHEGFSRAFARQFGVPPTKVNQIDWSAFLYHPELATEYYRRRQKGKCVMSKSSNATDKTTNVVFVQILERPARKLIFKSGRVAEHYFEYCEEVGCAVYDELAQIQSAIHEPLGLWWPDELRPQNCSVYVQGVEVPHDYSGNLPAGYAIVDLPACSQLVFQGAPFEDSAFEEAITAMWDIINDYDPAIIGYEWAPEDGPRFQLAPMGYRGYIEGKPVRKKAV